MRTAEHHSGGLLAEGTREWSNYYSDGRVLTPASQISAAEHHSGRLPKMATRE